MNVIFIVKLYKLNKFIFDCSKFINKVLKEWDSGLESLSLSDALNDGVGLGGWIKGISVHLIPMGEDALWEGSSGSGGSEGLSETEGLSDWKVSLHLDEWGSGNWLFTDNNSSSLGEDLIDWTNAVIWALDLD